MDSNVFNELSDLVNNAINSSINKQGINRISELLLKMSQPEFIGGETKFSETGLELSSERAGACIDCHYRTPRYWRALDTAIAKRKTQSTIRILYPGCGPFATLVLPLFLMNIEQNIELVLVDVNELSIKNAKHLWQPFARDGLKISFELSNVLDFQASEAFDIIIFECLLRALDQEAQVAITIHVSKFLQTSGQLIPESIECSLVATTMAKEIAAFCQLNDKKDETIESFLAPFREKPTLLLNLDKSLHQRVDLANTHFCCGEFDISHMDTKKDWVITTIMKLDHDNVLYEYQCGLTYPHPTSWNQDNPQRLKVLYRLRPMPGFYIEDDNRH